MTNTSIITSTKKPHYLEVFLYSFTVFGVSRLFCPTTLLSAIAAYFFESKKNIFYDIFLTFLKDIFFELNKKAKFL